MYENPIQGTLREIQTKIIEAQENYIMQVVQDCGVSVDKEELIKALMYDRQQYEKGYADAKAEQGWIPVSERLPEQDGMYYVTVRDGKGRIDGVPCLWSNDKKWMIGGVEVIAWIKIPAPYRGEER